MAHGDKTLQNTSQNPKHVQESKNTSKNPKHAPKTKNTSKKSKYFPESKTCLDSGNCFWILGSILDSGKCFWILRSVFGFWEVFLNRWEVFLNPWDVFCSLRATVLPWGCGQQARKRREVSNRTQVTWISQLKAKSKLMYLVRREFLFGLCVTSGKNSVSWFQNYRSWFSIEKSPAWSSFLGS